MAQPIVFPNPLTGNEMLRAFSKQASTGRPCGEDFLIQTAQLIQVGGIASGSFTTGASNTVLANVTGMTCNLISGVTYIIEGYISCVANATAGLKLALSGTSTASTILTDTWGYNTATLTAEQNATAIGTIYSAAGALTVVEIGGTFVCNASGTIQLQAAQSVSNGTACTITNGSYITFTPINV